MFLKTAALLALALFIASLSLVLAVGVTKSKGTEILDRFAPCINGATQSRGLCRLLAAQSGCWGR